MKKAYLRIDVSCYNGCHIAKSKTRTAAYTLAFKVFFTSFVPGASFDSYYTSTSISIYEFVTILKCFSYKLQKVPNLIFVIFGVGLIQVDYF